MANEQPNQGLSQSQFQELIKEQQRNMLEFAKALREPSDDEKEQKEIKKQQRTMLVKAQIQGAEDDCRNFLSTIRSCSHKNKRKHTWVANICPNGIAVGLCQRCRKDFFWKATDQQKMQGINLFEFDDVDEARLRDWEKRFPPVTSSGELSLPTRVKYATRAGMSEKQAWAI